MRYEISSYGRTFDRSSITSQNGPVKVRILVEGQYGVTVSVGSMTPRVLMPWETYDLAISQEPITIVPTVSGVSSYIRTYRVTRTICADKEVLFVDESDILGQVVDQEMLNDVVDLVDNLSSKLTQAFNSVNSTISCYGRPAVSRTTLGSSVENSYIIKKIGISDNDLLMNAVANNLYGAYGFGFIAMPQTVASMSLGGLTITIDNRSKPVLKVNGIIKTVYKSGSESRDLFALYKNKEYELEGSNAPIGVFCVNMRSSSKLASSPTSSVSIFTSDGRYISTGDYAVSATLPDDYNIASCTWRSNDRIIDPVVYIQGQEDVSNVTNRDLALAYFTNSEALKNLGGSSGTKLYRLLDVPDGSALQDFTNGNWTGSITGTSIKEHIGNAGFGTDTVYMYSTPASPNFVVRNSILDYLSKQLADIQKSFSYDSSTNTTRFKGNVAYGETAQATGQGSIAAGNNSEASGNGSVALGDSCIAENLGSIALGTGSKSTGGKASIAAGNGCIASGSSSVAVGWRCNALGANSFCGGGLSNSHTDYSFTWGGYLETYGSYSVNFGYKNTTNTFAGITSGTNNKSGSDDVSVYGILNVGDNNTVLANQSFALGRYNTVSGAISGAIGSNLTTTRSNHLVLGNYNSDGDYFLSVGCGNSDSNRQNAFTIDKNGNVYVKGNLTVDGTITSGGNILATGTIQSANDILAKTLKTNLGTIESSNVSGK